MSMILGIETSCDETGVALIADGCRIVANQVASQIPVHAPFGGVVPEIASRQHVKTLAPLVRRVLSNAGEVSVTAIAATHGPGLMGSLLVGVNFAKALAFAWNVPYVPVHHLEGHIFSAFIGENSPAFPFLTLLVSGGHTCIIACDEPHKYRILGTTRDDAVGECFDKVARLLELPYPGGPSIQRAAETGNARAYAFPRPMCDSDTLDFSYSGLKTAVLYTLRDTFGDKPVPTPLIADLAASFQEAAVDILLIKTRHALAATGLPALVVAGGVAANERLRDRLQVDIDVPVFMPPLALCVDNGAMIAAAAHSRLEHGVAHDVHPAASASLPLA